MEALIITAVVVIFIALVVIGVIQERKRQAALLAFAQESGLTYRAEKNASVASRYEFLNQLDDGRNRYIKHWFSGSFEECQVHAFDHHHATTSTDSKGRRRTKHHWKTVALVELPRECPEITIAKEGLFSKIAQGLGWQDIDFESAEFSKKFVVRSKDKRFTYDFIQPRVMEILLDNRHMFGQMEVDRDVIALVRGGRQDPSQIAQDLKLLCAITHLFPQHLADSHSS